LDQPKWFCAIIAAASTELSPEVVESHHRAAQQTISKGLGQLVFEGVNHFSGYCLGFNIEDFRE